ncbi:MAG: hypothetical protein RSB82_01435 [Victivallaceae bacterium]
MKKLVLAALALLVFGVPQGMAGSKVRLDSSKSARFGLESQVVLFSEELLTDEECDQTTCPEKEKGEENNNSDKEEAVD